MFEFTILEIPEPCIPNIPGIRVAACNPEVKDYAINGVCLSSRDNETWDPVCRIQGQTSMGRVIAIEDDHILIEMLWGALRSVRHLNTRDNVYWWDGEIITFKDVELVDDKLYSIKLDRNVLRGLRNTPILEHVVGGQFIAIRANVPIWVPLDPRDIGKTLYYKVAGIGEQPSNLTSVTYTSRGSHVSPPGSTVSITAVFRTPTNPVWAQRWINENHQLVIWYDEPVVHPSEVGDVAIGPFGAIYTYEGDKWSLISVK